MSAEPSAKRRRGDGYENGNLLDNVRKLYLSAKTADVYFLCGPDDGSAVRVPAHKNLLAAGSDVFDAMFYGSLKENGDVKMTDVSAVAFEEFLQFFYKSQVQLTAKHVPEIMHLGHKYNVIKCFDVCVQFLKSTLTNGNVCLSIGLATLYDQIELLKACEKRIIANTDVVFKSPGFLKCDKKVLAHILKMNLLSCSEVTVFEACMSWVKAKTKQCLLSKKVVQQHLGDLFYEIRFASMTLEDLTKLTVSYDSIISSDFKDIAKMITLPDFQPKKFKRQPRQIHWKPNAIVRCNRALINTVDFPRILKPEEMATFSTNEPLILGGLICSKLTICRDGKYCDLKSNHLAQITIVRYDQKLYQKYDDNFDYLKAFDDKTTEFDDDNCLASFQTELQSKETKIVLPKPILIIPGYYHNIQIKRFPEEHCYFAKYWNPQVQIQPDVTVKFYCNGEEDHITGLINALEFNRI